MEKWKPHPIFPEYEGSSLGRVRSTKRKRPILIACNADKDGYLKFAVWRHNVPKHRRVASFIAECWIGPARENMVVAHENGNRQDNRPENLRYKTQKENIEDKRRHGTLAIGERNFRAKLTEEQVVFIFTSKEKPLSLVLPMGLKSRTSIDAIRKRKAWTHVTSKLTSPR